MVLQCNIILTVNKNLYLHRNITVSTSLAVDPDFSDPIQVYCPACSILTVPVVVSILAIAPELVIVYGELLDIVK